MRPTSSALWLPSSRSRHANAAAVCSEGPHASATEKLDARGSHSFRNRPADTRCIPALSFWLIYSDEAIYRAKRVKGLQVLCRRQYRIVPLRHQIARRKAKQQFATSLLIEEISNELVRSIHDVEHQDFHLGVIKPRQLAPGDLSKWRPYHHIRVVAGLRIRDFAGVEILKFRISEALLNHILGEPLLQDGIRDEPSDGLVQIQIFHGVSEYAGRAETGPNVEGQPTRQRQTIAEAFKAFAE
jgi:hypothetical protein